MPNDGDKSKKTVIVLGAVTAALLAAMFWAWRAVVRREQEANDWKGVDKRDTKTR